jgi:hypothetical protein
MNKVVLYVFVGFLVSCTTLTGCLAVEQEKKMLDDKNAKQYRCPMKCTEEIFDKPGKCPNCGMELILLTES